MKKYNDLSKRGYHVLYRHDEINFCPGCARSHWLVGRFLAECAFCGAAVPLESEGRLPPAGRGTRRIAA